MPTQCEDIRWVLECEPQIRIAIYRPSCRPGGYPWHRRDGWFEWLGLISNDIWQGWNCSRDPWRMFGKRYGRSAHLCWHGYCELRWKHACSFLFWEGWHSPFVALLNLDVER